MIAHSTTSRPRKIHALVARVRFETAVVSFSAGSGLDDQQLKDIAVDHAIEFPENAWRPADCDDGSHQPFAVSVIAEPDPENEASPAKARHTRGQLGSYRFLLLQADIENGEGALVLQPWFSCDRATLLMADVAKDWIAALQRLQLSHFTELD